MKRLYSIVLLALAAFVLTSADSEPTYRTIDQYIKAKYGSSAELLFPRDNGVQFPANKDFAYSKNISKPFGDGNYYIKLESFALGTAELVDKPSDIVLLLDVSGSMRGNYGNSTGFYPYGTSAANSAGISWSHIGTTTELSYGGSYSESYMKYNGEFYKVKRLREYLGENNTDPRYYLYFETEDGNPDTRHWLSGLEILDTKPAGVTAQNGAIWWGRLWRQKRKSKMDELKDAVAAFIDIIDRNDQYVTDEEGEIVAPRVDDEGNPTRLGNRISVIKFAGAGYYSSDHLAEGNHFGIGGVHTANYTEVVKGLTPLDATNKQALLDAVDGLVEATVTAADYGTALANEVFGTIDSDRDSKRTLVFFTDGEPNHNDGFVAAVANDAIVNAGKTKTDYKATVFTVGVFTSATGGGDNTNVGKYMNRVSSNFEGATTYTNGTQVDNKYYKRAENDLVGVFADIAKQSGGSQADLTASTSNVDIVSSSFILPEGASTNVNDYVKVFTAPLTEITSTGEYVFGTETLAGYATDTYDAYDDDGNFTGTYKVDEVPNPAYDPENPSSTVPETLGITVALENDNGIKVTNFDYKNNWCGPITDPAGQVTYHGHKIIILIPIQMNPDAVGGPNVETNAEGSGVFAKEGDDYAFVAFKSPTVSLPVNLYIEKAGLKTGESAKFKIERAIIPDDGSISSITDWDYVSTVFVTNSPNAKHNPESPNNPWVRVRGLPATTGEAENQKGFIYRITEENWAWSYDTVTPADPQYTDTEHVENPFLFTNSNSTANARVDVLIRHAESKATNGFKPSESDATKGVIIYDDSKNNNRN